MSFPPLLDAVGCEYTSLLTELCRLTVIRSSRQIIQTPLKQKINCNPFLSFTPLIPSHFFPSSFLQFQRSSAFLKDTFFTAVPQMLRQSTDMEINLKSRHQMPVRDPEMFLLMFCPLLSLSTFCKACSHCRLCQDTFVFLN